MRIENAQLAQKMMKMTLPESLDKNINQLPSCGCILCVNIALKNPFSNKVTINLNVFNALMKDRIACYMQSGLIVIKRTSRSRGKTQELEQIPGPNNFTGALAIARYSASANEQDTVACFLDFQEIGASPILRRYPVIKR